MVAEDEIAFRELLAMTLRHDGFNVFAASNALEALTCLRTKTVDLMLLDLGLGSESGIDLLRSVRSLPNGEKLPVILLTGCSERNTVRKIAQMGVQGYMLKSQFSWKDLVARINRQLEDSGSASLTAANSKSSAATSIGAAAVKSPDACEAKPVLGQQPATSAEALDSLKPIITREQAMHQAEKCAELKALSATASQLMSMTSRSDCSLEQIAKVIKQDQAISLKVLKIANSVVYSRGDSVDTVQKALARIGTSQIRQLVLNISVIDNFQANDLGEQFNSGLFWEHSIATGLIAAAITRFRHGDEREIDRAFTCGLLHDFGRMVFADQFGDKYKEVLDAASRLQLPLDKVESRMLTLNHAEFIDRVLKTWQFPEQLVEPIAMHHMSLADIRSVSPNSVDEVSILTLANRFAHAMLLGASGDDYQHSTGELVQLLGLQSDAIKFIEQEIPEQTKDMRYAMFQSCDKATYSEYRQFVLKKLQRPVRALYLSANPASDAYRILFARMRETTDGKTPTIAVLHLADVHDRDSLSAALLENEKNAGVAPLPLIVISSFEKLKLDPKLLARRTCRMLPSPFTLSRLTETINDLSRAETK